MKAIYANSLNELISKMIGYNHDRCNHHYIGKTSHLPEKYKGFTKKFKYIFLFTE